MELKQLTENVLNYLEAENINEMSKKIFDSVIKNDYDFYDNFLGLFKIMSEDLVQVSEVLSEDFMQKIFQYYLADRKEKMQDYTPKSLADFMGLLVGDSKTIIDMCAGSGALTIQKWNRNHELKFVLYEFDENVIPFLLFNMAIRNIECIVCHADVLQMEVFKSWKLEKAEKFCTIKECDINEHINF